MPDRKISRDDLRHAAETYRNWGRWGPDDEIGTLNHTTAEDIVAAAGLVKKGKVISLALNFDHLGPQGAKSKYPSLGRTNPIHTMLRTGTDAYSGVLDGRGIRAADDMVAMPLQCGTQWDGLGHVFYEDCMWNGYDCREVTSAGAQKCEIEKTKAKMVGRGVLLDVAHFKSVNCLDDGYGVTCEDLDGTASGRAWRSSAAISSWSELAIWSAVRRRAAGTAIPAAMPLAWPSRRWNGSSARSLRPWPPTPGAPRCDPTTPNPASTNHGTGSPSRSWG